MKRRLSPVRRRLACFAWAWCAGAPAASEASPVHAIDGAFLPAGVVRRPMRWEVADDVSTRAQGLMYRRRVPPGHGMLFVFEEAAARSFWMKDTYVSLDMVFADAQCRIVYIIEEAAPHSTASQGCRIPSQYVVEVPAGSARRLGAKEGGFLGFSYGQGEHAVRCPKTPDASP